MVLSLIKLQKVALPQQVRWYEPHLECLKTTRKIATLRYLFEEGERSGTAEYSYEGLMNEVDEELGQERARNKFNNAEDE